jgi:PAS domain-containing protein
VTTRVFFQPLEEHASYADAEISDNPDEWLTRIHPDDAARVRSELQDHLHGRTSHFENEHRMLHENGTYLYVLTRGLAVRDAKGESYRMGRFANRHNRTQSRGAATSARRYSR